jgi:hypothetical protein
VPAADRADHGFEVARGAGQGQVQQFLLGGDGGGGAGDAGDRSDLGIGDPAGGERLADAGQISQGVGDPEVLGGGAQAHPGMPGQPVCTRPDAVACPPVALVELG